MPTISIVGYWIERDTRIDTTHTFLTNKKINREHCCYGFLAVKRSLCIDRAPEIRASRRTLVQSFVAVVGLDSVGTQCSTAARRSLAF